MPGADSSLLADVGRILWIGFEGPQADDELRERLRRGEAGGVVLFRRNLVYQPGPDGDTLDTGALIALNRELHEAGQACGDPLLISVDQEGGRVQRVKAPATVWPPMFALEAIGGARAVEVAQAVGQAIGHELRALGFDIDFAPVLDVHTNPHNPIIGDRAFGTSAATAAERALAFARGLAHAGILACGKHFPGHGDTDTDSHLELPVLSHDMERLREVELAPFGHAANASLPMIMTAHVVFKAIDPDVPATLSRKALGGILRGELQYRGLIVSDDLDMKAISTGYGVGDAAVLAVDAGCDALLLCRDRDHQQAAFESLVRAGERDQRFRARLALAAAHVRSLGERLALRPDPPDLSVLGSGASLAAEMAG